MTERQIYRSESSRPRIDPGWEGRALNEIKYRKISRQLQLFSFSGEINRQYEDGQRRMSLEEILHPMIGSGLENVDIVGCIANLQEPDKRIRETDFLSQLTEDEFAYFKEKYGLANREDVRRVNLDQEDLDSLHSWFKDEAKEFMLMYATIMRVCHSFDVRQSGSPYEVHPLKAVEYHFHDDHAPFELPDDAHYLFKDIDAEMKRLVAGIKQGSTLVKGYKVRGESDKPYFKKPTIEDVIITMLHDTPENLCDLLIDNYVPDPEWSYDTWAKEVDTSHPQKVMAILYSLMAEAYNIVSRSDRFVHKNFFYRSIKSITYALSGLTKNRFDSYNHYIHHQILHPREDEPWLTMPFDIRTEFLNQHLPQIEGVQDKDLFIRQMKDEILKLELPRWKYEKIHRSMIRCKNKDHHSNSQDLWHFPIGKIDLALFKARSYAGFVLEYVRNKKRKDFYQELISDAITQNEMNLHVNYKTGMDYIHRLLNDKRYEGSRDEINDEIRRIRDTLVNYIPKQDFVSMTEALPHDVTRNNPHPWPDGWTLHMYARIRDKAYAICARAKESDYRVHLQDVAILYSLLRFRNLCIKELGVIPELKGHELSTLDRRVDSYLGTWRQQDSLGTGIHKAP